MGHGIRIRAPIAFVGMALLACGLSAGCAPTELKSSWRSPTAGEPAFGRVMVIGMARRPDIRRMYEDAFVRQLGAMGVPCVASYTLLPDEQMTDKAAIAGAQLRSDSDAVLVTRLVNIVKQDLVVPPGPRLQEYVDTAWPGTYTPEVAGQTDIVTLETRLFDASTGQLVWSGMTQTFDAQNLKKAIPSIARTISNELAKQHLIRPGPARQAT